MKELIKPNQMEDGNLVVNMNCGEQKIAECPNLKCICNGKTNDSIASEEILF